MVLFRVRRVKSARLDDKRSYHRRGISIHPQRPDPSELPLRDHNAAPRKSMLGGAKLGVGAKKEDLPALRNIAQVVSDRFKNLWRRFCETTGADSNDEPGFYAGLYDGLMRETRKAGKAIPARNRRAKKSRRKAPVKSAETNVRPHVYSIALELGAEIRLNKPLERITSLLDDLLDPNEFTAR